MRTQRATTAWHCSEASRQSLSWAPQECLQTSERESWEADSPLFSAWVTAESETQLVLLTLAHLTVALLTVGLPVVAFRPWGLACVENLTARRVGQHAGEHSSRMVYDSAACHPS